MRELIEITLVKNPGMRYRSGGPFADAVAAVRAGRRPPRPKPGTDHRPGRPGRHPVGRRRPGRGRADRARAPRRRPRPGRRPAATGRPPPRRTFSSGQRALLWAAGVLGALAIIIAMLIVLNAQDEQDQRIAAADGHRHRHQTTPQRSAPPLVQARLDRSRGHRSSWSAIGVTDPARSRRPHRCAPRPGHENTAMTTPQHLSDRYELGEILGFGGMSEVHLARDLRLHRDVAVKVLRADLARDPSFYLRFRREAQNAAALNHPAIVAVYDTGEAETPTGPLPYIVMEYVEGVTLRDIVHTDGPMPPRRAIEIIADACQALNFSHQHGIIHRDVKPANIMISKTGAVKVMDFGIARAHRRQRQQRHPDRRGDRHRAVPVARAGPRRDRRRPLRRLLAGLRALRNPHRRTAFRR